MEDPKKLLNSKPNELKTYFGLPQLDNPVTSKSNVKISYTV